MVDLAVWPTIDLKELRETTGVVWRTDSCRAFPDELFACGHHSGDGRICRVALLPSIRDDTAPMVIWNSIEILQHREVAGPVANSDRCLVLRRSDTASSATEAARLAICYRAERREMAGRLWFAQGEGYFRNDFDRPELMGWICPIGGQHVEVRPNWSEEGRWTFTYPLPALAPLSEAMEWASSNKLTGKAESAEEAAAAALAAPGRFRQAASEFIRGTADGDLYRQGVMDGRAALFAEIAALLTSDNKPARPENDPDGG